MSALLLSAIIMRDSYALEIARAVSRGQRPDPFAVAAKAAYEAEISAALA